ncbi:MAG: methyltransferase domain-containing protein [Methylobacteriaceae bacterium]|nr:methyltransferase domain-containing protein [Methylobacteriaceae bacterium]
MSAVPGRPALATPPHPRPGLTDRVLAWRDALLVSPAFHRLATRLPLVRWIARRQSRRLFDLCAGFVYAQVLAAAVELRLFELLAAEPLAPEAVAARTGLAPDAALRLCGAAASLGLLERRSGGRFGLGLLGAATLGNPGVAAMVAHHGALYADLADPVALLRRGSGDRLAAFWPYRGASGPAEADAVLPYTRLMAVSQPLVADLILDAYPVARHRAILDVGGGDGAFLEAAARRAPALRATLFDLPAVAELAGARFARAGLGSRAFATGGDLRQDPLPRGHDLVTLVRVLHDHDDSGALALLRAVAAALPPGGTLLVAEPMAGLAGAEPVEAYFAFYLLAMGQGRPRSPAELSGLMRRAGFERIRRARTANPLLVSLLVGKLPANASIRIDS